MPILDILDWTDVSAVLDLGCGNGKWLIQAASRCGGAIVGLDLSAGMLSAAARQGNGAYLLQADAGDLPVADGSFDRVLAMWMLYHVDDRDRAVGELRRVLRPGGQALVVTNGSTHLVELDRLVDSAGSDVLGRPVERCVPAPEFTLDEAAPVLADHFDIVTCHVVHRLLDVPDPAIVVAYVESVRSRLQHGLADRWDDMARALNALCQRE